jgi:hypothetical protein
MGCFSSQLDCIGGGTIALVGGWTTSLVWGTLPKRVRRGLRLSGLWDVFVSQTCTVGS